MKLKQLEAVRAVLTRGTTIQAAEALGLTQSTVSRMIAQLEREIGMNIFDRRHGKLFITPEGRQFYDVAKQVLTGMDQIATTARDIRSMRSGALRIIVMPALGYGFELLPETIAQLKLNNKDVKISIDIGSREQVEEGVAQGRYDIGVETLPVVNESVEVEPLLATNGVCIAPAGHEFEQKKKIQAQDLKGMPFVTLTSGTVFRYSIDELFGRLNIDREIIMEAPSSWMVCTLVAKGLGVSIIHPLIAKAFGDTIISRPFEPSVRFEYGLLFPAGKIRSQAANAFVEILKDRVTRFRQ